MTDVEKITYLLNIRDALCYNLIEAEGMEAFDLERKLEMIEIELHKAGYDD